MPKFHLFGQKTAQFQVQKRGATAPAEEDPLAIGTRQDGAVHGEESSEKVLETQTAAEDPMPEPEPLPTASTNGGNQEVGAVQRPAVEVGHVWHNFESLGLNWGIRNLRKN